MMDQAISRRIAGIVLDFTIKPWRKTGSHVVVCPPARLLAGILNFDADQWLTDTLATSFVRRLTGLCEYAGRCAGKRSCAAMARPWLTICEGHGLSLRTAATLASKRYSLAFQCFARTRALRIVWVAPTWDQIETPVRPGDRVQWAWNLAANQWTLEELAAGTAGGISRMRYSTGLPIRFRA